MSIGDKRVSDLLVNGFVVVVLLLSTGALLPLLVQGGSSGVVGSPPPDDVVTEIVWLAIYGVALVLVATRAPQCLRLAVNNKILLLLVGVAAVSVVWSDSPGATVRNSVALAAITMFGIYLAGRYTVYELLRLLAWALGIAALLSIVFAVALPSYGITFDVRGNAWQGVFVQKNILGRVMALSALVFLLLALSGRRYRWLPWAGFGISVALLFLSGSLAPAACLVTLVAILPFYAALRSNYNIVILACIFGIAVAGAVSALILRSSSSLVGMLGRDMTLTGRTEVWDAVLEMIWQRPLLGYGYGGFWLGWEGGSAQVWLQSGIMAGHAHNGLLNLWLDLGLLGVSVFLLGLLLAFRRAVGWARSTSTADGLWPLAFLTFLLLYNLIETALLSHTDVFWILYVAAVASTSPGDVRVRVPYSPSARTGALEKARVTYDV